MDASQSRSVMKIRRACTVLLVFLASCCPPAGESVTVAHELHEFVHKERGAPVIVMASLNGKRRRLLLDTGTGKSEFDATLKPELGERIESAIVRTGGKLLAPELFKAPTIHFGTVKLETEGLVSCRDLKQREKRITALEIDGILGMDYLKGSLLQIDFDAFTVSIDHATEAIRPEGKRIPLAMQKGRPYVDVAIDGTTVRSLVDLGGIGGITLDKAAFAPFAEGVDSAINDGGFYCKTVGVGDFVHENHLVSRYRDTIMGLYYWNRYKITFDFADSSMYLSKGAAFATADHSQCDGAAFQLGLWNGTPIMGFSVVENSLVHKQGVRFRDVLLRFDGRNVSALEPATIERNWCQRGDQKITIQVGRNYLDKDPANDEQLEIVIP
jgi:hypothetical protein